jgi:LacI family transcriptional regulator
MAVRLKDIAEDLGVSTVTVSKVLRGAADISEKTRTRVLARMRELNYQPNMQARGLASGRSYAVGLVVPDLVHPFFGEFAKSLGVALRADGFALVVASSEEDPEIERQEIQTLLNRGVDVLLVASCQTQWTRDALVAPKGVPLLLIDRMVQGVKASFVGSNDVRAGGLAARHLIGTGRRRIAHIGGQGMSPSVDRLKGFRAELAARKISLPGSYVITRQRFEESGDEVGYQAMQELLSLKTRPDAVFCYNDLIAIGAMQATLHAALRIPEDVAFVGCGNLRYAEYLRVPLTSIDHQTEQMGIVAAKLTLELANHPKRTPETVLLEPKLVVRRSSVAE